MEAIIYTSNTGSTKKYAELLGHELAIPVYDTKEAKTKLSLNTKIIYLGWIMAGKIQGYTSMKNKYEIVAVCAVGMGQTGTQIKEIRKKNNIPESTPLFTLQGNFNLEKLHGLYKIMMNIMIKTAGNALEKKGNKTLEEEDMLEMMKGGQRVSINNLHEVIEWYKNGGSI